MTETHELQIGQDFMSGQIEAECSCGWSETYDDVEDANEGWENHCDVVLMEATMKSGERADD